MALLMDDCGEAAAPEASPGPSDGEGGGAKTRAAGSGETPEVAAARWARRAAETRGPERAEALCRQAEIVEGALGRADDAHVLRRRALLWDPHHGEALAALLERAPARDPVRRALLLALRFQSATASDERALCALALARLESDDLHNPVSARAWLERGVESCPEHAPLREALTALLREGNEPEALLQQLEAQIRIAGDTVPTALRLEVASLRAARGDDAVALSHLRRAAADAPDDVAVIDALVETLARLDRHGDLADVLERRIALAGDDDAQNAARLLRLGRIQETKLFDPEAALDAYERAETLGGSDPALAEALTRLRAKRSDGDAAPTPSPGVQRALAAYEREAEVTNDRERLGVLVGEIEHLHARLGTPDGALTWVQRWVAAAPEEPEALRALARLLDRPDRKAQLTATLEHLDRLLPPAEQLGNRLRLAELYAAAERPDEAAKTYARALELDPESLVALRGRADCLRALDADAPLVAALEALAACQSGADRVRTWLELAKLHERSGDVTRAIAVLERLERTAQEDARPEVSDRLDDLLARALRYEELAERLATRAAQHDAGSAEAVAFELRRATVLLDKLQRPDEAAPIFQRVLEHAPASRDARSGLERALRSSVDAEGLAGFLEQREEQATDAAERDRLALERAVLLEDLLERSDEALGILTRLCRESGVPEILRDAQRRAEQILERNGQWFALRDHLHERLGRESEEEDARLHERLARLCAERLDDEAGEIEHLERVAALAPRRADVWQSLAARYERDGRVEEWARALEAELASGPDHVRELSLRGRLAELYLARLARPDLARAHYERVFELSPLHNAAAQYLLDRAEEEGRFEEVVRLLESRLAAIDAGPAEDPHAPSRRTALRLQIAHVRESKLDDPEGAISALEVALGEVGPDAVVAEPLAVAYRRGGYSADLIDLCERAAAASGEAAERANWLIRLGDAHLERDEELEAADAYRRALAERPGDRAVEASLRELYRGLGRRAPLCTLLESELRHLAGTAEIPVRAELVDLLRDERPEDAFLHARRILELAPGQVGTFETALALSESLSLPEEALDLIETRAALSQSTRERAALALRRARLLAALARPGEAIDAYRAAADADSRGPEAEAALAELAGLLEREGRHGEWLVCWERLLPSLPPEARGAHLDRAARVAWEALDPAAALPWLERLRAERPDDAEVLARITLAHRERGDEEALLRALAREAEATRDPARRRACHLERALLLRARGAAGRALAALADAGPDPEALREREAIERELGLHAQRATTLEALLSLEGPDLARHSELAALYADELGAPDAAVRHWEAAREQVSHGSGHDIEILRAMAAAERAAGRLDAWARHAEAELTALGPDAVFDDRRRELRRELALAYDEHLARPGLALAHLRALLDAGDEDLLGSESRDQLELMSLRLLRAEGDVVELERRLAARLARRDGSAAEWLDLAGIREEQLRHVAAAHDAYREAHRAQPADVDALRGMRRTAEVLGRWSEVARALDLEFELDAEPDPTARGALLRALGDLHWHRLSSTTQASRFYAAALEANAADFAALRALERLLEAMEDWRGALDLYESEVEVLGAANPARRREIWLHVAALARDRAGDPERARQALARADEIEPLATPDLAALAALHESVGDREAFARTYAAWCDAPDADASPEDHLRLAEVLESQGELEEAIARIDRSLAIDAENPATWDAAARMRAARGDLAGSAEALRRAAEQLPDGEAAQRLHAAAESVLGEDPGAALALLRSAAARCPEDGRVQATRAEVAARLEEHSEAEEAASAALGSHAGALDRAERARIAALGGAAARRRGRLEAAAGLFAEALRLEPGHLATLGAYGETLVALRDHPGARRILGQRLEDAEPYPDRAAHRALLGECIERAGEPEEALVHYEAALDDDPREPRALEASARVLEAADRIGPGIRALERWASAASDGAARAARLLRAAEWGLRRGGAHRAGAEGHLRGVVAADPDVAAAWIALAQLQLADDRPDEVVLTTDRAARHLVDAGDLAAAANLQALALEQKGVQREAATLYAIAAESDPRRSEAALAQARLLRGFGEWREAAVALATFAERHPDRDDPALADVHEQLGRLRAGPLEDLDGAVLSYRRAIELAPERFEARAALAELLSHRPGDWDEALAHHRRVLAAHPTHGRCLRVALRIARGRGDAAQVATGAAIQRALGIASAYESEEDAADAAPFFTEAPALADERWELLRRVAVEARDEIDAALGGGAPAPEDASGADPVVAFRTRVLGIQGELSAPALLTRSADDAGGVLELVVQLVLDPDEVSGDGNLVNALAQALGRRRRRKLRKLLGEGATPADFTGIDWEGWHQALRALAAAEAQRRDDTPLRVALVALVGRSDDDAELVGETHLAPRVEADATARAFLARAVDDWLRRL